MVEEAKAAKVIADKAKKDATEAADKKAAAEEVTALAKRKKAETEALAKKTREEIEARRALKEAEYNARFEEKVEKAKKAKADREAQATRDTVTLLAKELGESMTKPFPYLFTEEKPGRGRLSQYRIQVSLNLAQCPLNRLQP